MKKTYIAVLVLLLISSAQSLGLNENAGTGADAKVTLDRPWYVEWEIALKDFWQPLGDIWSWIADVLFINNESDDSNGVQEVG